jgi:acetyl/propionyl-CoA carboxylase alpha subunit
MSNKQNSRKSALTPPRITAAQFDAKLEAGEDVSEYFDSGVARVFSPGKSRRKKTNKRCAR